MKVIFVIGLPRSGTTVFSQNFSKRFNSLYLGESHADSQFYKGKKYIDKKVFVDLINFVRKRIHLNRSLNVCWEKSKKSVIEKKQKKYTFEDWIEFLYSFGNMSKLDCIIDDTPTNYFYLYKPISNANRFYIFLIKRRLEDVLLSHIKAPWGQNKFPGTFMFKYSYFYHLMLKIKNLNNSKVISYSSIGIYLNKIDKEKFDENTGIKTQKSISLNSLGRKITKDYEIGDKNWAKLHLEKSKQDFILTKKPNIPYFNKIDNYILSIVQSPYFNSYGFRFIVLVFSFCRSRYCKLKDA